MKAGIIGSTGYAGQQLVGLLNNHPEVEIDFVCSYSFAGQAYSEVYPIYRTAVEQLCIDLEEALLRVAYIDVLFIALPHGKSSEIVEQVGREVKIIDLGADFRMKNPITLKAWYNLEHKDAALLKEAVYGLTELNRTQIKSARLVANPGCYPTATLLGILPLLSVPAIDLSSIIVDAKSGASGAGRQSTLPLSYCETNENFKAYSVTDHRHTPEIESVLSLCSEEEVIISFTPHLVPMQRGILVTTYVNLKSHIDLREIKRHYETFYGNASYVRLVDHLPETKHVSKTNYCDIAIRYDHRTHRLIIISAIDNLLKGSAGQAIQNMNIMMGFPETQGLKTGLYYL